MNLSVKDKLVLVTGASSGIGKATALCFAEKDAKLALVGKDPDHLAQLGEVFQKQGAPYKIFRFDLCELKKIPELVRSVQDEFKSPIDILVSSAGIASLGYVEEVEIDQYQKDFLVNFFAPLALFQAVVPSFKKRRQGQIIVVNSGVALRGLPGVSPYCTSKGALHLLVESIRVELMPFGVSIISFSPGPVASNFIKNQKTFGTIQELFTASKNFRSPEEVGQRIVRAAERARPRVELSNGARMAKHLNYWAPSLFDKLLQKKMKRIVVKS